MELTLIQKIVVWIIPLLLAITLHEAAHAYVAYKLGDPTAKLLGRVSANPLVHIDPIGTILVPLTLGLLTHFNIVFGWAKPVPFTRENFKNKRRDTALVALAGPLSNLLMAFGWALLIKIITMINPAKSTIAQFFVWSASAGILVNTLLCVLNLLPIPPLDGGRIMSNCLPPKYAYHYDKVEPYGLIIIVLLIVTNILGMLLTTPFRWIIHMITSLFGL